MTTPPAIRTALVLEDLPAVADWLVGMLPGLFPGVVVRHAATLSAARASLRDQGLPSLALVDLGLPDGNGVDFIRELAAAGDDCIIVVTTLFGDDGHLFPALRAGAQGYLLKDQPRARFEQALRGILAGEPPLSPAIAQRLLRMFNGPGTAEDPGLTPRERDVLVLVAKGCRLPELATQLGISRHTASDHVKSIYRKLKIGSRAEAALEAARLGLVNPSA